MNKIGIALRAGEVILVMAGHYGGIEDVGFGVAQEVEHGVWGYISGSEVTTAYSRAIMVRPHLKRDCHGSVTEETTTNFSISQNKPNPFDQTTTINYQLKEAAAVSVEFVDVAGKVVFSVDKETQAAGNYQLNLNSNDFSEGIYFYTFTVGTEKQTKRMIVTK